MTFTVGFIFIYSFAFFTLNDVQGTFSESKHDVLSELQKQIVQILDKQRSYEIKLTKQQEIIDKQAAEISFLKKIIFEKFDIDEERNIHNQSEHGDDTNDRRYDSIFMETRAKGANKNSFPTLNTFIKRNEKGLSQVDFKSSRSYKDKEVHDSHVLQTTKGLQKRQVRAIAFSVYLSHDADLGGNQIVRFDKVITNEGNGYNIHSGAFTCPEGGLYLLSYFVGERDIKGTWLKLKVNSVNIIDAAVDTYHDTQDLQGGNTVILRLNAGDIVLVESHGGHVEGSDSLRLTSFSGVLLSL